MRNFSDQKLAGDCKEKKIKHNSLKIIIKSKTENTFNEQWKKNGKLRDEG